MAVNLKLEDGIAILVLENPPLNLIDVDMRRGLHGAIDAALERGAARLIVTGSGKHFVAGADTKEFGHDPANPQLNDVLLRLAQLPIPTIAAINGTALGGGLEIALACRFRIATRAAQLGLPEVVLGVVPGAGGTQRLPRLTGIRAALDLIATGRSVSATEALPMGLIDRLADDPVAVAVGLDSAILGAAQAPDDLPAPAPDPDAVDAARARARKRMPGQVAPGIAVDLVAASATIPLSAALSRERAAFLELRASDQARALRHVFFAERAAIGQGRLFPQPMRDIATAIVVGGGNMGSAIAYTLARARIPVTLVERDAGSAERAAGNLRGLIDQGVARGTVSEDAGKALTERLTIVAGYADLPAADLAIEAAFEDLAVKHAIFTELEAALPPTTILATNTSYLDVNSLANGLKDPSRLVGLHFFSPAHIMKLLEIVRGDLTAGETLGAAFALARRLGKIPVLARVCDGFIGNRILARYRQVAIRLLAEGATPPEVDDAMRGFGMAMGPFATQDLSGLDIACANIRRKADENDPDPGHIPLIERLVEGLGRLGRKSGAGWYDYGPDGKPANSDIVASEIHRVSQEMSLTRRCIPAGEIVERLVQAMIAEACEILEEGIAERPQDIDLVLIHGYGFPLWRGGLMYHAETSEAQHIPKNGNAR